MNELNLKHLHIPSYSKICLCIRKKIQCNRYIMFCNWSIYRKCYIHVYFKVGFNKEAVFLYRNQGIKIFSSIYLLVEKKLLTVSHYSI